MTTIIRFEFKGGKGSGNFDHVGRPGKVGGSGNSRVLTVGDTVDYDGRKNVPIVWAHNGKVQLKFSKDDYLILDEKYVRARSKLATIAQPRSNEVVVQERAVDENWTSQKSRNGATLVYHGTSVDAARKIQTEGLKTFDGNRLGFGEGRPDSVYFSTDKYQAQAYGEGNMYAYGASEYAIVKISVPSSHDHKVIFDDVDFKNFGIEDNFRMEQNVPASWITGIDVYDGNGDVIHSLKEVAEVTDYYTTILIVSD